MKIIKKLISTVLALAIVFTFSSVAFAVEKESVEPLATCNHTWNAGYTEYIENASINATSTTCQRRAVTTKTCTKCGQTIVTYSYTNPMPHSNYNLNATCNGYQQTLTYKCRYCETITKKTQKCPGAGHSGLCPYLPF